MTPADHIRRLFVALVGLVFGRAAVRRHFESFFAGRIARDVLDAGASDHYARAAVRHVCLWWPWRDRPCVYRAIRCELARKIAGHRGSR